MSYCAAAQKYLVSRLITFLTFPTIHQNKHCLQEAILPNFFCCATLPTAIACRSCLLEISVESIILTNGGRPRQCQIQWQVCASHPVQKSFLRFNFCKSYVIDPTPLVFSFRTYFLFVLSVLVFLYLFMSLRPPLCISIIHRLAHQNLSQLHLPTRTEQTASSLLVIQFIFCTVAVSVAFTLRSIMLTIAVANLFSLSIKITFDTFYALYPDT